MAERVRRDIARIASSGAGDDRVRYERGDALLEDTAADAYASFPDRVLLLDGEGAVVHSPREHDEDAELDAAADEETDGAASTAEVAETAGTKERTTHYRLDKLRDQGRVSSRKVGGALLWMLEDDTEADNRLEQFMRNVLDDLTDPPTVDKGDDTDDE